MRVLVTGGSGFIGSHLTDRLLARGDDVLVIDNYATGRRDNLTGNPNLTIVEGDISDRDTVNRAFDQIQPEYVVHAAASYKDPNDWNGDIRTNVLGSANVAQAAQRLSVQRIIYFQTALCYGLHPIEQPITIEHPIRPTSSYAISKTAGEQYLAESGLELLSFRLANAYGPRNLSGPLPTFYSRLTTDRPCFVMNTRRDFIFVDDLIDVVMGAMDGMGNPGYYHISSGSDFAIKELYDEMVSALGLKMDQEVEVRERGPDDAYTILLDPLKTNQDFRWQAKTPLAEGVRRAIDYYRTYGITQTFTHLKPASE